MVLRRMPLSYFRSVVAMNAKFVPSYSIVSIKVSNSRYKEKFCLMSLDRAQEQIFKLINTCINLPGGKAQIHQ